MKVALRIDSIVLGEGVAVEPSAFLRALRDELAALVGARSEPWQGLHAVAIRLPAPLKPDPSTARRAGGSNGMISPTSDPDALARYVARTIHCALGGDPEVRRR